MTFQFPEINSGLYLVATPIGTASDITLRALNLLKEANILVAEDTRVLKKLLNIHDIELRGRKILAYNDYSASSERQRIIKLIQSNNSVVFVSDAGTPLIADPGYKLVKEAIRQNVEVRTIPGASALTAALVISGLPTNNFFFAGFVPSRLTAKEKFFLDLIDLPTTLIFFETAKRLSKTLKFLNKILKEERQITVCRELTKKYETVIRGTSTSVNDYFGSQNLIKGEIVLLVGPPNEAIVKEDEIEEMLLNAFKSKSLKDAVELIATKSSRPKSLIYKKALKLRDNSKLSF